MLDNVPTIVAAAAIKFAVIHFAHVAFMIINIEFIWNGMAVMCVHTAKLAAIDFHYPFLYYIFRFNGIIVHTQIE